MEGYSSNTNDFFLHSIVPIHIAVMSSPSSSSSTCHGRLAYVARRIRPGAQPSFQKDFEAWLAQDNPSRLSVGLAFPDPSDAHLLHLLVWDDNTTEEGADDVLLGPESDAFEEEDADGVLHVYGSGSATGGASNSTSTNRKLPPVHMQTPLAGYMRRRLPTTAASKDTGSLPLIGVFKRAIHSGKRDDLAQAFQRVCDIWYKTVPGILAAMVFPDPTDTGFVHDIRIFDDKASYDAHVDKSNPELTRAMEEWFSHYDTSIPHKGIMVAEDTSDPAMHTSSIKKRPVKVDFNVFHYGQGVCMGRCLHVTF